MITQIVAAVCDKTVGMMALLAGKHAKAHLAVSTQSRVRDSETY